MCTIQGLVDSSSQGGARHGIVGGRLKLDVYVPGWLLRIVPAGFVGLSKDLALNITEMGRH